MKFDEKKAIEVIKRYNLNENTLGVWKTRSSIPDRYFKDDFVKREAITERADRIISERVKKILKMKELNVTVFRELLKCPLTDIANNKSTFSPNELFRTVKEIKRLRIDVLKTFEHYSPLLVKKLIVEDKRVKPFVICKNFLSKRELQTIREQGLDSKADFKKLKDAFVKFAIQLSIE